MTNDVPHLKMPEACKAYDGLSKINHSIQHVEMPFETVTIGVEELPVTFVYSPVVHHSVSVVSASI